MEFDNYRHAKLNWSYVALILQINMCRSKMRPDSTLLFWFRGETKWRTYCASKHVDGLFSSLHKSLCASIPQFCNMRFCTTRACKTALIFNLYSTTIWNTIRTNSKPLLIYNTTVKHWITACWSKEDLISGPLAEVIQIVTQMLLREWHEARIVCCVDVTSLIIIRPRLPLMTHLE